MFYSFNIIIITGLSARPVQLASQRFVENFNHQGGFTRPRDAGNADQLTQRDGHINILQIILARADHSNRFSVPYATLLRDRDFKLARKISPGQGFFGLQDLFYCAFGDDPAALLTCPRSQIYHPIRGADRISVMFDNHHRVPQIAQTFQSSQQAVVIPRVQSN